MKVKRLLGMLLVAFALTGCGDDPTATEPLETELERLIGEYTLIRVDITVEAATQTLRPPEVTGTMTISPDKKISQTVSIEGTTITLTGTFELELDEDRNRILIDNDHADIISQAAYRWDGNVLMTTVDTGAFIETDYWEKGE